MDNENNNDMNQLSHHEMNIDNDSASNNISTAENPVPEWYIDEEEPLDDATRLEHIYNQAVDTIEYVDNVGANLPPLVLLDESDEEIKALNVVDNKENNDNSNNNHSSNDVIHILPNEHLNDRETFES